MSEEPITIGNDLDDITDALGDTGLVPQELTEPTLEFTEDDITVTDNEDDILDIDGVGILLTTVGQDEESELHIDKISSVLNLYLTKSIEPPITKEVIDDINRVIGNTTNDSLTSFLTSSVDKADNQESLIRIIKTYLNDNKEFLLQFFSNYIDQINAVRTVVDRIPKDLDIEVDSLSSMVTNMENVYLRRGGKKHVVIYEEPLSVTREVLDEDGNLNPYFDRLYELCEKLNVTDKSIINITNLYASIYKSFKLINDEPIYDLVDGISKVTDMLSKDINNEDLFQLCTDIRRVILFRITNVGDLRTYGVLNTIFLEDTNIFTLIKTGCIGAI